MANQGHVKLLRRGVAEWNQWRNKHLETPPDLREAKLGAANLRGATLSSVDLRNADLREADLGTANLYGANLSKANLRGATLSSVDLSEANLSEADLRGANLSEANLGGTNLYGANLREANLGGTNLYGANLRAAKLGGAILRGATLSWAILDRTILDGADLRKAIFSSTTLAEVDLRSVKGLLEIRHQGPSIIQLHSIQLPQDGSTLHFLRGAGIPDEWIDFYRSSMMHPIQYHSCFISYASNNKDAANRLHADLQANGVRCWFAPHDLKPGDYFREEIDKAIHMQEKLLLILSEQSVASKWVRYEVRQALDREVNQERTILFPIRLDDSVLHTKDGWAHALRSSRHIGNFTRWQEHQGYQEAFTQLLKDLKDETK